ncbi:TPA: CsbD family protein [Streptococcus pneumoniae]|nr:CsbD-like protein [Streptococcus pneumoniae]HEW5197066.1 CsbD family protein [Streptococcus pneumoniae]
MSLENKLEQATGAVKEGFGKVTGDSKTELEGAVEKTVAKAKDVVEGAVEGLKNVFTK